MEVTVCWATSSSFWFFRTEKKAFLVSRMTSWRVSLAETSARSRPSSFSWYSVRMLKPVKIGCVKEVVKVYWSWGELTIGRPVIRLGEVRSSLR